MCRQGSFPLSRRIRVPCSYRSCFSGAHEGEWRRTAVLQMGPWRQREKWGDLANYGYWCSVKEYVALFQRFSWSTDCKNACIFLPGCSACPHGLSCYLAWEPTHCFYVKNENKTQHCFREMWGKCLWISGLTQVAVDLKPLFLESCDYARLPACHERKRVCLVFEITEEKLNTERYKKSSFRMLINTIGMLPHGKILAKLRSKW